MKADEIQSTTRRSENGNVDVSHQPGDSTLLTVGLCMPLLTQTQLQLSHPQIIYGMQRGSVHWASCGSLVIQTHVQFERQE